MLLIDKPAGPTSRQVAEQVGRAFGVPRRGGRGAPKFRVGHAGTLDPLATGLLVVLVGKGTRLQTFLQGLDKRYAATIRLGTATASLDRDGEATDTADVPAEAGDLTPIAARFQGELEQVPPVVSALKRGGRSLHELARRGQDPAPPAPRIVRIDALSLVAGRWGEEPEADEPGFVAPDGLVYELELAVRCGSGTYVRSLARDIAAALGTVGHVHRLRRLVVGPFDVSEALAPDAEADVLRAGLRPLADALPHLPAIAITDEQAAQLRLGSQPDPEWVPVPVPASFRFLDAGGELVAVGRRDPETGAPATAAVFPAAGGDED